MTYPDSAAARQIAQFMVDAAPEQPRRLFLWAEAARACVGVSLYQEFPDHAMYIDIDHQAFDLILDIWYDAPEDKKWTQMLLDLDGDHFTIKFEYGQPMDEETDLHDYREDALKERFGDKPVRYPPVDWEEARRQAIAAGGDAWQTRAVDDDTPPPWAQD